MSKGLRQISLDLGCLLLLTFSGLFIVISRLDKIGHLVDMVKGSAIRQGRASSCFFQGGGDGGLENQT